MRLASGVNDQYIYFVAVDATDLKTRETGLSSFTVYRSRNGAAAAAYTTPTINETDVTNMPGVYELLVDEDVTIDVGDETQEICLHITHAGMAPVTRVIELYRPKITAGVTLAATGTALDTVTTATNVTTVNGLAANVITATSIAADAITDSKVASDVTIASVTGAVGSVTGAVGSVTGNVGGNVVGSVGSVTGLTAANLDVAVSSRLSAAGYTAPDNASITAILADTGTDIPATLATLATASNLATVAGYLDTEIADIKAKTDNLPASPAATGDIPTATQNADALLNRDMSAVSDTNSRSPLNALRVLRNKWSISGTTITHTKEDDSTTAFTASLTATAGADPITGSDPS